MNWLSRLERKWGRYAIRNLPLYIVIMYAVGAVLNLVSVGYIYFEYLSLNPYMILHGQPWRLITFLIAAPTTNVIFLIFVLLFYYYICRELSNVWGAFRFNLYFLFGVLASILGAFLVYIIYPSSLIYMDTYYLNLSFFLAYAAIFPEAQVYLYGILPLKVKWLAYVDVAFLLYAFVRGSLGSRISIVVSLLNFLLFFFSTRDYRRYSPGEFHRKREFHRKVRPRPTEGGTRHKCAVCGRTEEDDPTLEFRYCSKCNGDYEYCNEHLFSHTHVR